MSRVLRELWFYYFIRCVMFPFRWLPLPWVRAIGRIVGVLGFYVLRKYRKRTLSNLALASNLEAEILAIAKQSFQNLAINCLEYPRLDRLSVHCENPEVADALYKQGQGILFFCAHQSNWEVLFLDGTARMKGVAIGKSIKNKRLYQWIVSMRERNGGKIIAPHNAIREGLRALKKGIFVGIVGDQGMPRSGYSFPFLGRKAWTSTAPALLAYRTNSPVIFAETRRVPSGYKIHYSEPIWPDLTKSMEEEVPRLMDAVLRLLETSVKKAPGEWLWQHNRWKQQTPHNITKRFRHDCLCIIMPSKEAEYTRIAPHLSAFRDIYPTEFISLLVPESMRTQPIPLERAEYLYYREEKDVLLRDYRFKLVFNFTENRGVAPHYLKLSAFEVLTLADLQTLASCDKEPLSLIFKRALYRPKVLEGVH